MQNILKKTKYFSKSKPEFKPFSKILYDYEYAKKNLEKILILESKINLDMFVSVCEEKFANLDSLEQQNNINYFESSKKNLMEFCKDHIDLTLSFDKCGIHSIRFDFNLKSLLTPELIETINTTCYFVDEFFFNVLNEDLLKSKFLKKDFLTEHMTYSVISCTDAYISPCQTKKEIFGISWKKSDFLYINDNIIDEITSNDIAVHKEDILTVTTQAVFMVFFDIDDKTYDLYVTERINAVEIFWRQKILLKKVHFLLDSLIKDVEKNIEKKQIETAITNIRDMQITIQSELEVYKNTIISVTHSYYMLFETLNAVSKMDTHYNFIKEKIETCNSIYESLNDAKRNKLMENIQCIVIIIGLATILLSFLTGITYYPEPKLYQLDILFIMVSFLYFSYLIGYLKNQFF